VPVPVGGEPQTEVQGPRYSGIPALCQARFGWPVRAGGEPETVVKFWSLSEQRAALGNEVEMEGGVEVRFGLELWITGREEPTGIRKPFDCPVRKEAGGQRPRPHTRPLGL
jgi:hypothetical protein